VSLYPRPLPVTAGGGQKRRNSAESTVKVDYGTVFPIFTFRVIFDVRKVKIRPLISLTFSLSVQNCTDRENTRPSQKTDYGPWEIRSSLITDEARMEIICFKTQPLVDQMVF
jgi:hypothetical protein